MTETAPRQAAMRMEQLFNVSGARPSPSDILVYDAAQGKWIPQQQPNFDTRYAPIVHNHNTLYAPLSHAHAAATTSVAGFMATGDKSKLDGVATGATNTPLSSTSPVPISTSSETGLVGTGTTASRADHRHSSPGLATASVTGFMSTTFASKLDGIEDGATNTPLSSISPRSVASTISGTPGTDTAASRRDHRHETNIGSTGTNTSITNVSVNTTYSTISGLTVSISTVGLYLVTFAIGLNGVNNTANQSMDVRLMQSGTQKGPVRTLYVAAGMAVETFVGTWVESLGSAASISIQIKASSTGISLSSSGHDISATYLQ